VKSTIWLLALLLAGLLGLSGAGCKKQNSGAAATGTPEQAAFQLRLSLQKASPEVQNIYNDKVDNAVRYEKYQDGIAALDLLVAQPGVTEEQKKLANQLSDLLKAKLAAPAPTNP
jgi:hypothetical protein